MTSTEVFLIAILVIFTLPYLVWRVGRTDYWAPLVVVQIICGILLGPGILGALWPAAYNYVFNPPVFAAAALLLVASVAGKLIGVGIAGRLLGWPRREARLIGWLLQTKALIMIIFANILLDKAISPARRSPRCC